MKEKEIKVDYEQLYYDLLYSYKQLEQELSNIKQDLNYIDKKDKRKLDIKNIILSQLKEYKDK